MISPLFWRLLSHTQKSFLYWNFLNKKRYSGPTFILFSGAYNHTDSSANLKLKKSYLREPQQALAVDHYSKVGSDVWTPIFECTPTQTSERSFHILEFKHRSVQTLAANNWSGIANESVRLYAPSKASLEKLRELATKSTQLNFIKFDNFRF